MADEELHKAQADTDVSVAVLQEKLKNLEALTKSTVTKLEALEKDRDNALKWGVMLLGTAVVSMAAWVFNHLVLVDKVVHS